MQLSKNTFYLMRVSMSATRDEIDDAAKANVRGLDQETLLSLRESLSDSTRRLEAEMGWFLDASDSTISVICNNIADHSSIDCNGLAPYSRFVASVYNYALETDQDPYDIGYEVWDLDSQFSALNVLSIVSMINHVRKTADIPSVSVSMVEKELLEIRTHALQSISKKIMSLELDDYCDLMSILADRWKEANSPEGIIDDLLEQYEAMTKVLSVKHSKRVIEQINSVQNCPDGEIPIQLASLISSLKEWRNIVYPVQIRYAERSTDHKDSIEVGNNLQALVQYLLLEKRYVTGMTEFCSECRAIFAPIEEISNQFTQDLESLQKAKENVDRFLLLREEVKKHLAASRSITDFVNRTDFNSYIHQVEELNQRLQEKSNWPAETRAMRRQICHTARSIALSLVGKNKYVLAEAIYAVLLSNFSDLEEYSISLQTEYADVKKRNSTDLRKDQPVRATSPVPQEGSSSNWKRTLIGAATLLIMILTVVYFMEKEYQSKPKDSPGFSFSTTESPWSRQLFNESAKKGDKVYAYIISIFPSYGVYTENGSSYHHFLCECQTPSNTTVWLYISVSDYRSIFDQEASSSIENNDGATEIKLASTKVYGYVDAIKYLGVENIPEELKDEYVIRFNSVA